ncbi:peptidase MA family metallohydrolase [Dehalococcoidia bacterium]|nr:peptidase MA family metallohydrolase [Dehalococcoidia bacterium]
MTHILTHRASTSVLGPVPSWLGEGLSEYGNIAPGFSYDIALEFALATGRLLPITSMKGMPGDPEDVIIFYGQASSLVRFMVNMYGPATMRQLMKTLKEGTNIDDAILEVYRVTRVELENLWRDSIGAPAYVPPDRDRAKPTPIARREIQLFTLTPQAGSETIASVNPTPAPIPEPLPEPTPATVNELDPSGGASCNPSSQRGTNLVDLTAPMFLVGLVGLSLRRRRR